MEPGVDLVLTTGELISLIKDFPIPEEKEKNDSRFYSSTMFKTSSMGYAEYVFSRAVNDLYGAEAQVEVKTTRRRDVLELQYQDLVFCIASGFQNIQNLIRELKAKKCKYCYIEVMACPAGCLNGGGQPRMTRDILNGLELSLQDVYAKPDIQLNTNYTRELKLLQTNSLRW